jgi:hypothetical protein
MAPVHPLARELEHNFRQGGAARKPLIHAHRRLCNTSCEASRGDARLGVAVSRGLLLDLVATDDRTAVDGPVSATRSCMRATGRVDECSVENQTCRAELLRLGHGRAQERLDHRHHQIDLIDHGHVGHARQDGQPVPGAGRRGRR